jgi:hypothetical protein
MRKLRVVPAESLRRRGRGRLAAVFKSLEHVLNKSVWYA